MNQRVASSPHPAVVFDNVRFSYRTSPVLKGASFTLAPGGFYVLAGANGSGKSTLIKLLLAELFPNEGAIQLFGQDARSFKSWQHVGYVPQQAPADYRRFPATVLETVRAGLYAESKPILPYRSAHRAKTLDALRQVGLTGFEQHLIGELSGGQFQRMLLARAIVAKPKLLVLDEPTSNLDDASAQALARTASAAASSLGTTVLLVTHDRARLPRLHASMLVLESGTIQEKPLNAIKEEVPCSSTCSCSEPSAPA